MKKQTEVTKTKKKAGNWFIRNIIKLVIIFAAIAGLTLIGKIPKNEDKTEALEAQPVNVKVINVVPESEFADMFKLPGVVEPNRIVTISTEIDGRIESIPVTEGAIVKKGDLLLKLNTDLLEPQYEMAESQLKRDEIEYKRMANLVKDEAIAQSDLDNAKTKLDISKAQFNEIKTRIERASIFAPTSGVLNMIPVEEGEYIQPGTPVAEIVDNDTVKVVVDIPERDISFFSTGEQAEVHADFKGQEKVMNGDVTFISALADNLTRSTRIEITLANEEKCLHSGQIVSVVLTRQILKDVILIPLAAVIPMENGNSVYIANSSVAKRRDVEIGIIKGDKVQIKSGLQKDEHLIVSGHRLVVPGQTVNIVDEDQ
ncbi:MAG: efflux RND transporter periplasmic adaptor subunit [Sedimentisphaerales bacterium]|nr:efflux RND transporter periplasmic adaptor subunit [Sedimentisphaerales bacterium]